MICSHQDEIEPHDDTIYMVLYFNKCAGLAPHCLASLITHYGFFHAFNCDIQIYGLFSDKEVEIEAMKKINNFLALLSGKDKIHNSHLGRRAMEKVL